MNAISNKELFLELCVRLWAVNRARDAAARRGNVKRAARLGRIAGNLTDEILSIP